jgi:hypothetical protein
VSIIVLTSASGSPGVTTTVMGLALAWPRPVLVVEADPTGGSGILAGHFKGQVAHAQGLIELAMAQRQDLVAAELPHQLLDIPGTGAKLLAGSRSHAQAGSLVTLWPVLLEALRDLDSTGQDVLVDAGRLGLEGSPTPLLFGADVTLLLTRSTLPALIAATSWAETLRDETAATITRTGVLVVGEGHPYPAREVAGALRLPLVAKLAWDRRSAAVLSRARGTYPKRGPLLASLAAAGEAIRSVAADRAAGASTAASRLAPATSVASFGGGR